MKKLFILFFCMVSTIWNASKAQSCEFQTDNINISAVSTGIVNVGGNCESTINVTFNLFHNSGLKTSFLYFYDGGIPFSLTGNPYTPSSTDLVQPGAFILLNADLGFVKDFTPVNNITPQNNYSIIATPITGGTNITITGLKYIRTGACTTSEIYMYIGASNGNSYNVQCNASSSFKAFQVFVSGKVDCTGPRNYDLIIETDYQTGSVPAPAPISGSYEVYVDANNDGAINSGEALITSSSSFSTIPISSSLNRFTSFDNNYAFSVGDPLSSANLLVRVIPTTPGVASLVGRLTNACGTLPVSMKSFNVNKQIGKVALTWETADEINNKGFEIQRRLNNGQYEVIAFVPAKSSNGGGASYRFEDQSLLPQGSIYYRLRQIDNDEQFKFSDVRLVLNNNRKLDLTVYPNPSNGAASVILPESTEKFNITLEDYTGRTLQRWNSFSSNNLQLSQLRPGIYMIRVQSKESGEQAVQRLLVQ